MLRATELNAKASQWVYALLIAIGCVAAGYLARMAIDALIKGQVPFVTFYPAVMAASLIAGMRSGILAVVISTPIAAVAFGAPLDAGQAAQADSRGGGGRRGPLQARRVRGRGAARGGGRRDERRARDDDAPGGSGGAAEAEAEVAAEEACTSGEGRAPWER